MNIVLIKAGSGKCWGILFHQSGTWIIFLILKNSNIDKKHVIRPKGIFFIRLGTKSDHLGIGINIL